MWIFVLFILYRTVAGDVYYSHNSHNDMRCYSLYGFVAVDVLPVDGDGDGDDDGD